MENGHRIDSPEAQLTASKSYLLDSFNIIAIKCDRFVSPDEATSGELAVKGAASVAYPDSDAKDKAAIVTLTITVDGKALKKARDKSEEKKYFSIAVTGEGRFKLRKGAKISKKDQTNEVGLHLTSQIHPLIMLSIRSFVEQMGFYGAQPELGFDADDIRYGNAKRKSPSKVKLHAA